MIVVFTLITVMILVVMIRASVHGRDASLLMTDVMFL